MIRQIYFGRPAGAFGNKIISGYVDRLGVVGVYPVHLLANKDLKRVRSTWSGVDGYYEFKYLLDGVYILLARDITIGDLRNLGSRDYVTPDTMP